MHAHNRGKLAVKVNGKKRYVEDPTKNFATYLLVGTIGLSLGVRTSTSLFTTPVAAAEPVAVAEVQLESVTVDNSGELVTPGQSLTDSSELSIEQIIEQVFGDQAKNAKKIAQCESRMNPEIIGDTHIMGMLDGEMIGDSIGLFQIRTGDAGVYDSKPWNRARANGMTVAEFRVKLQDAEYNVRYAKDIYDRSGWNAWYNCKNKVLN